MLIKQRKKWKILHYLLIIIIPGYVFVAYFNRIPERKIIPNENAILSPAHGKIIHIQKVDSSLITFFKKEIENSLTITNIPPPYHIVVIEMNLKNIHAQRAPISGEVIFQEHMEGKHLNALKSTEKNNLANLNEKNLIVFKNEKIAIGVIQVAGKAARRIRSYVMPGSILEKGQVYVRILLGSQVVVIIPANITLNVATGDKVIDGETILGEY